MKDISTMDRDGLPSNRSLIKATVIAFVVGFLLLLTAILPAEYGIDPTGLGGAMGLTALSQADTSEKQAVANSTNLLDSIAAGPVQKSQDVMRSDTLSVTLPPNQGAEIKAKMSAGDQFVFTWETDGGVVNFDMHGERLDATDEFTSFWVGRDQSSANGRFEAPFEGTHGWYWLNPTSEPLTVTVRVSGFYESLYRP
ncbi:hypothetical protein [Marinobacter fonticola]|uniref:hypothetical protein n=1 Tax=Marinobacter fonticola TaxID=2603215 RepID=UPI0011E640E6|nr:hypothetical protein [Marinobacter fonticola]